MSYSTQPHNNDSSHSHNHTHATHNHSHTEDSDSHTGIGLLSHSHSHSHSEPNMLLTSSFSNPAVRITWIGLIVNVGLAISKGVGGVYFHSQSLVADAIHSVSDMVADFLTLATVNVASKVGSPDKFPLGHGKIESIGSLLVSGILLFAGISVGWSSLLQVFEYSLPSYLYDNISKVQIGHSHSHSFELSSEPLQHSHSHMEPKGQIPDINAAWLAGGSIVIKEFLYQKTMKVAQQTSSKVLVANAWHHRVDSLTALVAVVTVTGGVLFNAAWLDSAGGILVSALIIRAGYGSFKDAIFELIDRGQPKTSLESQKYADLIAKQLSTDFKLSKLSILPSGANSNFFITLVSPKNADLETLNHIESTVVNAIKDTNRFVRNVFVQFKHVANDDFEKLTINDLNTE